MPELMVRLNEGEEPVPLSACFWVLRDKDGCGLASSLGGRYVDAVSAHEGFTPGQRIRDRETRQGHTVALLAKEQWDREVRGCFLGACTHRPKPEPDRCAGEGPLPTYPEPEEA